MGRAVTDAAACAYEDASASAVFAWYRPRLRAIAYRMLGDVPAADEVVAACAARWVDARFAAGRSAEPWLDAEVTRIAIERLRQAKTDRARRAGSWLPAPLPQPGGALVAAVPAGAGEPSALARDLSTGWLLALESLTPLQRAAFLWRDVFGAPYADVARVLGRNEAALRQLVHGARERVRAQRPWEPARGGAKAALRQRFLEALAAEDRAELTALLAPDATFTADHGAHASAVPGRLVGANVIVAFLLAAAREAGGRLVHCGATFGDDPGVASTIGADDGRADVRCVTTFDADAAHVRALYAVLAPDKLRGLAL